MPGLGDGREFVSSLGRIAEGIAAPSDTLSAVVVTTIGGVLIALIGAWVKTRAREPSTGDSATLADYVRRTAEAEYRADEADRERRAADARAREWEQKYWQRDRVVTEFLAARGYRAALIVRGDESDAETRRHPRT